MTTKQKIPFYSFQELNKNLNKRELVLFGRGNIAHKTARKLDYNYSFLVDNNPNMWGVVEFNKNVFNPIKLRSKSDKYFVVICTTSFKDVSKQLESYGYKPQKDFIISPILNDLRIISELEGHKAKILFTCSVPENSDPECGGGIYELVLDADSWSYRKVYSGVCQGIIKHNNNYIFVDDTKGVVKINKKYDIIETKKLPKATRGHGIGYCKKTESFYIVASYRDEILILDKDFNQKGSIKLSNKFETEGEPAHHANDLCIVGDSLYVTMFSYSGNWKKDLFDGAVVEIDLNTNEIKGQIVRDLWMPHNISYIDGSLTVLDSLRGELKKNNMQTVGRFPAFTRGLAFDGVYYYIGQSKNRNYSKNLGWSLNISINTGIVIFDEVTKVSRTIYLPHKLSEVHSILLID